jgi:hypothetical protein
VYQSSGSKVTRSTLAIRIFLASSIDWSIFLRLAPALDRAKPCAGYSYTGQPGHTGGALFLPVPGGLAALE